MSPTMSKGSSSPVDDFAPKAIAMKVTIRIEVPFKPALEMPNSRAARILKVISSGVKY